MGTHQQEFLERFKVVFSARFPEKTAWSGGQVLANTSGLEPDLLLRRDGVPRRGERFELGDLRCDIGNSTVIVEYESDAMAVHNLLKYWPYTRGELATTPVNSIILCHFSNWSSYGSYRDLWEWLLKRIAEDSSHKVEFMARQFDHGGTDSERAGRSLSQAIDWITEKMNEVQTA